MKTEKIIYGKDDITLHYGFFFVRENGADYFDLQSTIASRIKLLREKHDVPAEKLAKAMCLTPKEYFKMEDPEYTLPADKITVLAYFYNVSPSYLLGISTDPTPIQDNTVYSINGFSLDAM